MVSTIYIENGVRTHPLTLQVLARFPKARTIECERYGEVFNRNHQNFRLQKQKPSLILAKKFDRLILKAPEGYGIGGKHNYYFSHMLNCLYDCRYCFLQGMYRSASYVLFVNYEDFQSAIQAQIKQWDKDPVYFFSGYDCDSLALEPVTGFLQHFLPFFKTLPGGILELRTKSTQIQALQNFDPFQNCVVAYSLSPENIAQALEHRAPGITARIHALAALQNQGWPIGLRFDPLIFHTEFKKSYSALFETVFKQVDPSRLHSVSLGPFRVPDRFFQKMIDLYPDVPLFFGPLDSMNGITKYQISLEKDLMDFCTDRLLEYVPDSILYRCGESRSAPLDRRASEINHST